MKLKYIFILYLLFSKELLPQEENTLYYTKFIDFNLNLNYNTSAKLYLNPRSADPDLRNLYYSFDGFFSYAFELKSNLWNNSILIGLGTEYLKASELIYSVRGLVDNFPRTLLVEEGFFVYPIEIITYYVFPFSNDWFQAYMGAGFGVYYGKYYRKIYDLISDSKVMKLDYGILVNFSIYFSLIHNLSLKCEMKFRDPELEFKNEYSKNETTVNGNRVQLFEKVFYTKVNLNGLNLILGLNYRF